MPRPAHRTNFVIKKRVRTPGGRTVTHYTRRNHSVPKCARCGRPLAGVVSGLPKKVKRYSRTRKRPNRMFGGVLCPSCLATVLRFVVRSALSG